MIDGKGFSPEEFNKYLNKVLDEEHVEMFYRAHLINSLRAELFYDFTISLLNVVHSTYPGDDVSSEDYYLNHLRYCFDRVTNDFKKENIEFTGDRSDLFNYFYVTLEETYYKEPDKQISIDGLKILYEHLFNMDIMEKTQSDLEIFLEIYRFYITFLIKK